MATDQEEFLGGRDFRISDFTSHIQTSGISSFMNQSDFSCILTVLNSL